MGFLHIDQWPPQAVFVLGIVVILLGLSFGYKAFQAMIKGRLKYWDGFFPFTLASIFTLHVPATKNSLIKETEGLWVHMVMGPIYMFTSILFICAGLDLANMPGTKTLNLVLNGGKVGSDQVVFNVQRGYSFPILNRAGPIFYKLFNTQGNVQNKDRLYENSGSYNDAMSH